jgi:Domain of unknown function (DUF4157)
MSSPSSNGPRGASNSAPASGGPKPPAPLRAAPPPAPPRVPTPIRSARTAQRREVTTRAPVQGVFAEGQISLRVAVPAPATAARTAQPLRPGTSTGAPALPAALAPNAAAVRAPRAPSAAAPSAAVQRKGDGSVDAFLVNLPVSHGGQAMPDGVRAKMEAALGADFSDVRIHVGPQASSIGALAFTRGSDLYFAPGQYNPNSLQGQQILGHELTHVVQQRQGRVSNPFGSGVAVVQDRQLEAEADRMGWRAAMTPGPRGDGK